MKNRFGRIMILNTAEISPRNLLNLEAQPNVKFSAWVSLCRNVVIKGFSATNKKKIKRKHYLNYGNFNSLSQPRPQITNVTPIHINLCRFGFLPSNQLDFSTFRPRKGPKCALVDPTSHSLVWIEFFQISHQKTGTGTFSSCL